MLQRLNRQDIQQGLSHLNGWTLDAQALSIHKVVVFESFTTALRFIAQLGELAQAHDHHPEFTSNYTTLAIRLTTHDASGLTTRDLAMAQQIDQLLEQAYSGLLAKPPL